MTQHIPHVLDTCVVIAGIATTAVSTVVLSEPGASPLQFAELRLFLLPFIGALIMSGGFIMLNPTPETRRITIGRSIFALFFGILVPQIFGMFHPSLAELSVRPALLVMFGGICAGLAFVLSRPFTNEMYKRSDAIAKREADRLEQKYSAPGREEPPTTRL